MRKMASLRPCPSNKDMGFSHLETDLAVCFFLQNHSNNWKFVQYKK